MVADKSVATFFTTHAAMRAEKLLKEAGIPVKLIPTPRNISTDCTISLRFPSSQEERIRGILNVRGVETDGFYPLSPSDKTDTE